MREGEERRERETENGAGDTTRISLEQSPWGERVWPSIAFLPVLSSVPKSVMKTLASVPAFFLSPVLMVTENVVHLSAGEACGEVSGRLLLR